MRDVKHPRLHRIAGSARTTAGLTAFRLGRVWDRLTWNHAVIFGRLVLLAISIAALVATILL